MVNSNSKKRCDWVKEGDALYEAYHDTEWGVPVYDDKKIFEFLILESAQAGLSWLTVLRKRENYREAFADFDPKAVAEFTADNISALLENPGIIRNRLKVNAAVNNAQLFLDIQKEFETFSKYIWSFVNHKPVKNQFSSIKELPAKTETAEILSKDLKKRGFKFLGPTIVYAHMQATGMVNDHTTDCFRHVEIR
jgi:DNA-3-methyladenine glycosylase I